MMTLKTGTSWSSKATLRQESVLDRLEREVIALPFSPSPALADLYKSIGEAGKQKALLSIKEARQSSGRASAVIDIYFNRSLTMTIKYLLTDEVNEQD